jgi:cephalosporin-C deacetylase-like acetyl esterase
LLDHAPRTLRFDPARDFETWRGELHSRLRNLLGVLPHPVDLNLRLAFSEERETFTEHRFLFAAEENADVPAHLLIPHHAPRPVPVVICLQGHSTGMHISLGRPRFPGDEESIAGDRDFALQAVERGYAALTIEQRCFGERHHRRPDALTSFDHTCRHDAMVALLLGRTLIGERVWDLSRAIDALAHFPAVDGSRVGCMGNSGGGTITFFAACMEERIAIAMPSCYVCTFRHGIGRIDHCEDNYLPGALQYFELGR